MTAAAACLWPALAKAAQSWNPTASDAGYNTAAGTNALLVVDPSVGFDNTAVGQNALSANTSGSYNSASGAFALAKTTTGSSNTATGFATLFYNTTGAYNTANGANALYNNTTGSSNSATGYEALYGNTTGGNNTAAGYYALGSNTTGNSNTAVGTFALRSNNIGINNVGVGALTLYQLHSGHGNIALGFKAGQWTKVGSNNIYIGHYGNAGGTENKVTRIGQAQEKVFIAGIKGVALKGATVVVNAAGQLGVVASSARYKMNIHSLSDASAKLAQLHPVSYEYKTEPGATHYGLVAEEVDKVMPELVVRDEENRPESVQYQELIPLLLQQVKLQRALIERLEARVDELGRSRLADNAASQD
jgi:hypothetical protein